MIRPDSTTVWTIPAVVGPMLAKFVPESVKLGATFDHCFLDLHRICSPVVARNRPIVANSTTSSWRDVAERVDRGLARKGAARQEQSFWNSARLGGTELGVRHDLMLVAFLLLGKWHLAVPSLVGRSRPSGLGAGSVAARFHPNLCMEGPVRSELVCLGADSGGVSCHRHVAPRGSRLRLPRSAIFTSVPRNHVDSSVLSKSELWGDPFPVDCLLRVRILPESEFVGIARALPQPPRLLGCWRLKEREGGRESAPERWPGRWLSSVRAGCLRDGPESRSAIHRGLCPFIQA